MHKIVADLRTEGQLLCDFVASRPEAAWNLQTKFFNWTIFDEILHLYFVDHLGLLSLRDPAGFEALGGRLKESSDRGVPMSAFTRDYIGPVTRDRALKLWYDNFLALCDYFETLDPKARMKWFGPDMAVISFASARQMEIWAHGQDIYDLFRVRRTNTDRIKNIAMLGVRTFGWSFVVHGLPVPQDVPYVALTSPSNALWEWNDKQSQNFVRGDAEEFCLVVTQRRNVADTGLEVVGDSARAWMANAQCFAGAPETPPAPGVRAVHYG